MIRKEWFRFKKLRVLMAWLGVPLLIYFAKVDDRSYRWGALLMIAGELIRLWALCYVKKKGEILSMSGPYAFTRNPLYLGNFFLGFGLIVICANEIIAVIFLVGFAIMYLGVIREEETILKERFGKTYTDYCKNVPQFFPRLIPYHAPEKISFDWRGIFRHHEYVTLLGIIALLCGIHLHSELFVEKDPIETQMGLIIFSLAIVLLLVLERLFISNLKNKFAKGFPNLFRKKDS